jgi:hypothetical protein
VVDIGQLNASAMAVPYLEISQLLWSFAPIIIIIVIISKKTFELYETEIRLMHEKASKPPKKFLEHNTMPNTLQNFIVPVKRAKGG